MDYTSHQSSVSVQLGWLSGSFKALFAVTISFFFTLTAGDNPDACAQLYYGRTVQCMGHCMEARRLCTSTSTKPKLIKPIHELEAQYKVALKRNYETLFLPTFVKCQCVQCLHCVSLCQYYVMTQKTEKDCNLKDFLGSIAVEVLDKILSENSSMDYWVQVLSQLLLTLPNIVA
ncbi:hypothetical protein Ciccas_007364 [Cichlidogyrus casuarinus]|uniref:Uncharacterized protein n=1 Tax=Cichlidogyrus casuarinus TaxID=1844966 RepID=A0ABD2Q335_9PLAT